MKYSLQSQWLTVFCFMILSVFCYYAAHYQWQLKEGFYTTSSPNSEEESTELDGENELKCMISTVNGYKYCVRDRSNVQAAVDLLATTANKCEELVEYLRNKYPDNKHVERLRQRFSVQRMSEILPTSKHTAVTINKGEQVEFCLNTQSKQDVENLMDTHTLTFVALHELAHIMSPDVGHTDQYWSMFSFLLKEAKEAGIHEPVDYSKQPASACGHPIRDNPYFSIPSLL